jgi:hypothetical protein
MTRLRHPGYGTSRPLASLLSSSVSGGRWHHLARLCAISGAASAVRRLPVAKPQSTVEFLGRRSAGQTCLTILIVVAGVAFLSLSFFRLVRTSMPG